jgi:hypothetical protein
MSKRANEPPLNGSTFSCLEIGSETISRIKRFHAKRYAYMV